MCPTHCWEAVAHGRFGLGLQMGLLLITRWGSAMITGVAMITRVTAMITWRVAMIMLQWQIAAGGPSHFVGPFPFREPMPPSAICHCNLLCGPK